MGGRTECQSLSSAEGELISIRIEVELRSLEALLDALAAASFRINPLIYHGRPTVVEFPAYDSRLGELRALLAQFPFETRKVRFNCASAG